MKFDVFKSTKDPIWCSGCGDFSIYNALLRALAIRELDPKNMALVSGIGCSGQIAAYVSVNGFHTIHGRVLPTAQAIKYANPKLTVIGAGGDGDGLGIGGGHISHTAKRNPDITYIIMDNSIYGLTKGQASPTTPCEQKTSTTPYGNFEDNLNPIAMYLAYDVSFIAQGWTLEPQGLAELIAQAIEHPGFAIVHVRDPCPTYNKVMTKEYLKERVVKGTYDPTNKLQAFELSQDPEKIHIGVLYKTFKPTAEQRLEKIREKAGKRELTEIFDEFKV